MITEGTLVRGNLLSNADYLIGVILLTSLFAGDIGEIFSLYSRLESKLARLRGVDWTEPLTEFPEFNFFMVFSTFCLSADMVPL